MRINIDLDKGDIEVGKLVYGSVVTMVPSNPDCIYIKVDKARPGVGIELLLSPKAKQTGQSVLLNVKTGALRAIPGSTRVVVLDAELNLTKTDKVSMYIKERYINSSFHC